MAVSDVLTRIVEAKQAEVQQRRQARPLAALQDRPLRAVRDFAAALAAPGLAVIAEIKRRSPSKGALRPDADAAAIAAGYETHGAAAVSVLTDAEFFGGSDDDLRAVRKRTSLPVLRKDFTVDAYQIHEARALGADAILLIARVLTDQRLPEWIALAGQVGLTALVEVHDEAELQRAVDARARVIGINARDLATFRTDLTHTVRLRAAIPSGVVAVAESGIAGPADVARVRDAGFDACLIGEALMIAPDPGRRLAELLEVPA